MTQWQGQHRGTRMSLVLAFLVLALPAQSDDRVLSRLAPAPQEFTAAVEELEDRVARTRAVGVAVARLQNELGLRTGLGWFRCEGALTPLVARSRLFGASYRDLAQRLRVQLGRVRSMRGSPTVAPLLSPDAAGELDQLVGAAEAVLGRYLEAAGWQARYIDARTGRCAWNVEPTPGVSAPGSPVGGPVAVYALSEGLICQPVVSAGRGVVIIPDGRICVDVDTCECTPQPVLPGAVIGQPRPAPETPPEAAAPPG